MIFRGSEIATATGGTLVLDGPAGPVRTDSRRLRAGDWFLALRGDRFDGHDYLPHAAVAGCAGIIAEHAPADWTAGFVRVPDTLQALQDLAASVRDGFDGPVVGITGSAGKTTTRAMVGLALAPLGRVHTTAGNLNNHIGLPLTLLDAPVDAAAWVLELGMNHLGEIARLQEICRPTVRLITNVGAAHLEGVGSLDGVAKAKGELFDGAMPGDICCINADDPRIQALPLPPGVRVLRYGTDTPDGHTSSQRLDVRLIAAAVDPASLVTRFQIETPLGPVRGTIPGPGLHLAHNATAAVAVAVALHVPTEGLGARLGAYEPVGMRLRVEAGPGGLRVLNDAYNANPMSTAASLESLRQVAGARRVALLGDMLELGEGEAEAHAGILRLAAGMGLDLVGVAGPRYTAAARSLGLDGVIATDTADDLADAVRDALRPGDVVLLKGSRGMAMERVLKVLSARRAENTPDGEDR